MEFSNEIQNVLLVILVVTGHSYVKGSCEWDTDLTANKWWTSYKASDQTENGLVQLSSNGDFVLYTDDSLQLTMTCDSMESDTNGKYSYSEIATSTYGCIYIAYSDGFVMYKYGRADSTVSAVSDCSTFLSTSLVYAWAVEGFTYTTNAKKFSDIFTASEFTATYCASSCTSTSCTGDSSSTVTVDRDNNKLVFSTCQTNTLSYTEPFKDSEMFLESYVDADWVDSSASSSAKYLLLVMITDSKTYFYCVYFAEDSNTKDVTLYFYANDDTTPECKKSITSATSSELYKVSLTAQGCVHGSAWQNSDLWYVGSAYSNEISTSARFRSFITYETLMTITFGATYKNAYTYFDDALYTENDISNTQICDAFYEEDSSTAYFTYFNDDRYYCVEEQIHDTNIMFRRETSEDSAYAAIADCKTAVKLISIYRVFLAYPWAITLTDCPFQGTYKSVYFEGGAAQCEDEADSKVIASGNELQMESCNEDSNYKDFHVSKLYCYENWDESDMIIDTTGDAKFVLLASEKADGTTFPSFYVARYLVSGDNAYMSLSVNSTLITWVHGDKALTYSQWKDDGDKFIAFTLTKET